jgi:hypothetical protein
MKNILVCQVKDSFEYIPLFLTHNEKLFDEIHIIDQCSEIDLRDLNDKSPSIHFYKTSYSFFNAMIGINAVLEFKNIRFESNFTFILDIDEFLPFKNKKNFHDFLIKNEEYDAIKFQWRNGLNFSSERETLGSNSDIRFFNTTSSVKKLAYNAKKTPLFLPYHGNHNAKFHFLKFAIFKKKAKIKNSNIPILHIPFSSKENLLEKAVNFDESEFIEKIINRHTLTKEIYARIRNNTATQDDLCFFAANYRTIGREDIIKASIDDFEKTDLFASTHKRICFWEEQLRICKKANNHSNIVRDEKIARKILGETRIGGRYFFYQSIKKHVKIDNQNLISLHEKIKV